MTNQASTTVLEQLLAALPKTAAVVARFLATDPSSRERSRTSLKPKWRAEEIRDHIEPLTEEFPFLGEAEKFYERLSNLAEFVTENTIAEARMPHPDVLSLTCDLLTNSEQSFTGTAVRYAVILSLRTIYGIRFNADSVTTLRKAYTILRGRFDEQQRRRIRRANDPYEHFLIDILALTKSISRVLTADNLQAYYEGFSTDPLGVTKKQRRFADHQDWPELRGVLPDFPSVINVAFGHPLCIPGLDEVLGGLIPALPSDGPAPGGQVTLLAGAPGSGKTTLSLSMASRMAELGSVVRYVTMEEDPEALKLKIEMIGGDRFLANSLWGDLASVRLGLKSDFSVVAGREFKSLKELSEQLQVELGGGGSTDVNELDVYSIFPRVVVIDSLTILLHLEEATVAVDPRQDLADALLRFRELGVCVFLIGGIEDCNDHGLAYLVDNVLTLKTDENAGTQHPLRSLSVDKTRFQTSHRGRHSFHLSRRSGCVVHPSLHSLLRILHDRPVMPPDSRRRARLFEAQQLELPLPDAAEDTSVSLQARSHILVYGRGSAGKAGFATYLALLPRNDSREAMVSTVKSRERVLVVSFLYDSAYYRDIGKLILGRHRRTKRSDAVDQISVISLYPGYVDAETLMARIRDTILTGRLEGRPYTGVVVDGIHNVLLQYPFLEKEKLLWPCLFRLLRTEGLNVVSTFTFFDVQAQSDVLPARVTPPPPMKVSEEVFFHLLVSNCDYTFIMDKDQGSDFPRVALGSSIDTVTGRSRAFTWDGRRMALSPYEARSKRTARS